MIREILCISFGAKLSSGNTSNLDLDLSGTG